MIPRRWCRSDKNLKNGSATKSGTSNAEPLAAAGTERSSRCGCDWFGVHSEAGDEAVTRQNGNPRESAY